MKKETLGFLGVLTGNVIFGFSFLFSKIALEVTIPSVLIAVRFTVAFLLLNVVVLFGKYIKNSEGEAIISFSLKGKPKKDILLLALFQPIIYFISENYGILYTSSSFAGIIIATIPIVGIVLDIIFFQAKIGIRQGVCAVLSVFGVFLTTIGAQDMHSSIKGMLFLLVAVFSGSIFYVFSRQSSEYYSALERTYVMFGLGSVFYIFFAGIQCMGQYESLVVTALKTPLFWCSITYLSCVSSVIAFLCLNFGSAYISVARGTMLANITTVISIFAGFLVLHESFTLSQAIGAVIIVGSVYVATMAGVKEEV
ncbi:MAG: DMT family transporter [Eubacteriales bacterium]|nr:DMT family transporter [Eubacteriales bacterium]